MTARALLWLLAAALAASPPALAERPEWVERTPPAEGGKIYAVGIRTGAPTLEGGVAAARRDAVGKILSMYYGEAGGGSGISPGLVEAAAGEGVGAVWGLEERERYSEEHPGGGYDVWVLLEGSEEQIKGKVREFVNDQADVALQTYDKALKDAAADRWVPALLKLDESLRIFATLGHNSKAEALRGRVRALAGDLLAGLAITPLHAEGLEAPAGKGLEDPIEVAVTRKGAAAGGVPLRLRFLSGAGRVQETAVSDPQGRASAVLSRCDQGSPATLEVVPAFLSAASLQGARALIRVACRTNEERPVALSIEEWQLDRKLAPGPIEGAVEDALTHAGFHVLPPGETRGAEFTVRAKAKTQATEKIEGYFEFCRARGQVEVVESSGGSKRVVGSKAFDEKGAWKDAPRACLEALKRAAKVVSRGVLTSLGKGEGEGGEAP